MLPRRRGNGAIILSLKTGISYSDAVLIRFTVVNSILTRRIIRVPGPHITLLGVNRRRMGNLSDVQSTSTILGAVPSVGCVNCLRTGRLLANGASILIYSNFAKGIALGAVRNIIEVFLSLLGSRNRKGGQS